MAGFQTIRVDRNAGGIVSIWLNRPDRHNTLNAEMVSELSDAVQGVRADKSCRVVVLSGVGETFCAGGDLEWMRSQFSASREERMAEARRFAHLLRDLNELPAPVIGRINGSAFGGGMGLACVCDIAFAHADARFGFPETALGLIPATIAPYCAARMGEARARRVFMSARRFDAGEAVELGLVARAVSGDRIDSFVDAEIAAYLACAPGAVASAKALLRRLGPKIDRQIIEDSVTRLADCWESSEIEEGVAAFLEKRRPSWTT